MRMQVGRAAVAVAVLGAVVSGCGGPSQVGSAVIVGSESVPLEVVQSQLDTALTRTEQVAQLKSQGGGPPDIARSIVTTEIIHDLLKRQAATAGVAITDVQVDARLAEAGGADQVLASSIYDLPTLRERVRDDLTSAELGRRAIGGLAVTADLIGVASQAEAETTARTLAQGGPVADALFDDPHTSRRGEVYDAVGSPEAAATALFGVPVGGVVAFQPDPAQASWVVGRVTEKRTDAPFDATALEQISQAQLVAVGERTLQPTAQELGIRVNPRYGVWDPVVQRVVAADQRSGMMLPPAAG